MRSKVVKSAGTVGLGLTAEEVGAVKALISQRRRQVLVHSYLYYELGREIISDVQWDSWARELVQLQKDYPEYAECCVEAVQFRGFDATTGFHLEFTEDVKREASRLLKWHDRQNKT